MADEQAARGSHWVPNFPGQAETRVCLEPIGWLGLVPMDIQGKLEARAGPTWLLMKLTIQPPSSLYFTEKLLLSRAGNPRLFARPYLCWVPGFRGKG